MAQRASTQFNLTLCIAGPGPDIAIIMQICWSVNRHLCFLPQFIDYLHHLPTFKSCRNNQNQPGDTSQDYFIWIQDQISRIDRGTIYSNPSTLQKNQEYFFVNNICSA